MLQERSADRMQRRTKPRNPRRVTVIRPNSKLFQRGVIGLDLIDGRTFEGKYARVIEHDLLAQLGGQPTAMQRLMVDRVVKLQLRLDAFEKKIASDKASDRELVVYAVLNNQFSRGLQLLGLKGDGAEAPRTESFEAYVAGAYGAATASTSPNGADPPVKRGRGRPRKRPVEASSQ